MQKPRGKKARRKGEQLKKWYKEMKEKSETKIGGYKGDRDTK